MLISIKHLFNERIFSTLIFFYIAGIFSGYVYGTAKTFAFIIVLAIFSVILAIFTAIFKHSFIGLSVVLCVVTLFCGALHIQYVNKTRQSELREYLGTKGWVYGTVTSVPDLTDKGNYYSVVVDIHKIEYKGYEKSVDGKMRLFVSVRDKTAPLVNENIYFFTELLKPDFKDGTFDYELYLKTKNIYATGFTEVIYPDKEYTGEETAISEIKTVGRDLNSFFRQRIDSTFSYDTEACALVKGILLGDKTDFSDNLTGDFSKAGFSHIAAVSGLHLNILFGAFCGLLGFFKIRKKIVAVTILPVILLFAALTDFSPSVCRAAIMLVIHLFALLSKRQYDSISALFISALIILLVNPFALFNISFILSFSSTIAIILIYPIVYQKMGKFMEKSAILKYIFSSFSISVSAFIGTLPFVAYYFGQISLFSLIGNMLIIPLCVPIFILGYISCIITVFLPEILCNLVIYPLAVFLEIIIKTAEISANVGILSPTVPEFSPYWILLYVVVVLCLFHNR